MTDYFLYIKFYYSKIQVIFKKIDKKMAKLLLHMVLITYRPAIIYNAFVLMYRP